MSDGAKRLGKPSSNYSSAQLLGRRFTETSVNVASELRPSQTLLQWRPLLRHDE